MASIERQARSKCHSQLTTLQDGVEHLGCQRSEQEAGDGERIAGALDRDTSMKDFDQLVDG